MPVEHDEDHFEGRLSHALHDTGDRFDADRTALVAAGLARGRRLRLRRRATVVGGAAGIALVGVGGALLVPWGGTPAPRPSSSNVAEQPSGTPSAPPVTARQLIETLEGLLPEGKVSERDAKGATNSLMPPYVHLVHDDGKGPGAITVGLDRIEPGGEQARQMTKCPDKTVTPHDRCVSTLLPDGSLLKLFQGYEYPDRRVDTKMWTADLVTPAGQHVSVSEWNAAAEKGAPVSRSEPPLSTAQLKELAMAKVWRGYVDSIPGNGGGTGGSGEPTGTDQQGPTQEPSFTEILDTLVPLLPKGAKVADRGTDYSYLVVDDGKGRSLVEIDVQHGMGDVADELFGDDAETLPDGTLVTDRQDAGDKGVAGCVRRTVDTLRTDGFRVAVSAYNADGPHASPSRAKPALTVKQLREIALSPEWDRFR
ncbi:hypothetical protein [Streptomyces sp. HD]|uniref:hypothetical protein n=1 Tax=Streptomyces sp. HD TaxID=3020892 RepID=UPI0023309B54|nr:hypothetical protein [Streptomyces sp. HD]MDC0771286.1 hypothetical protein [Streptomyces sp. HD]